MDSCDKYGCADLYEAECADYRSRGMAHIIDRLPPMHHFMCVEEAAKTTEPASAPIITAAWFGADGVTYETLPMPTEDEAVTQALLIINHYVVPVPADSWIHIRHDGADVRLREVQATETD